MGVFRGVRVEGFICIRFLEELSFGGGLGKFCLVGVWGRNLVFRRFLLCIG